MSEENKNKKPVKANTEEGMMKQMMSKEILNKIEERIKKKDSNFINALKMLLDSDKHKDE